jgi:hypothetical protein
MFTIVYPHESVNILTVEVNDSSVFETSQVMLRFHFDKNSPIIISGNHFVVWQMQDNDWKIHRYVFQPLLPLE